ncbi:MAG: FISUMP domain-containing protein [Bacteroidales bacterium]
MIQQKILAIIVAMLSLTGLTMGQFAKKMPYHTSIISSNVDLVNRLVFVEFSNIPILANEVCHDYALRFSLKVNDTDLGYQPIKVISVPAQYAGRNTVEHCQYNQPEFMVEAEVIKCNQAPFGAAPAVILKEGDTLLSKMIMSSYHIALELPNDISITDSIRVSAEATLSPVICVGCGAAKSDVIFDPLIDIHASCPDKGVDFQACYQRESKQANWEAWILDKRDCHYYRAVYMPDERWWLAQNLNYQGSVDKILAWQVNADTWAPGTNTSAAERMRSFYCPSGPALPSGGVIIGAAEITFQARSSALDACDVYGALYPLRVALTSDGYALKTTDASRPNPLPSNSTARSTIRGVCPKGWVIPSNNDWGKMFNLVEANCGGGCTETSSGTPTTSTCTHSAAFSENTKRASNCLIRDLRQTYSAPHVSIAGNVSSSWSNVPSFSYPNITRVVASDAKPIWSYVGLDQSGTDAYGFSMLPTGFNNSTVFTVRGLTASFATANHTGTSSSTTLSESNIIVKTIHYNGSMPNFLGAVHEGGGSNHAVAVRCVKE